MSEYQTFEERLESGDPLTEKECEALAYGLWIAYLATGGDGHCKSYDPLTFWDGEAHSYVFDMLDGGRHHGTMDLHDVAKCVIAQGVWRIAQEHNLPLAQGANKYCFIDWYNANVLSPGLKLKNEEEEL